MNGYKRRGRKFTARRTNGYTSNRGRVLLKKQGNSFLRKTALVGYTRDAETKYNDRAVRGSGTRVESRAGIWSYRSTTWRLTNYSSTNDPTDIPASGNLIPAIPPPLHGREWIVFIKI